MWIGIYPGASAHFATFVTLILLPPIIVLVYALLTDAADLTQWVLTAGSVTVGVVSAFAYHRLRIVVRAAQGEWR